MSQIADHQIALRRRVSSNATLDAFLDTVDVTFSPPTESRVMTIPAAQQYGLVTSAMVTGNLAVNTNSNFSGSAFFASRLSTAVGTAATTNATDAAGNYLNRVTIRNAATHARLVTSGGFEIFGLVQCSSATADGAAIGASGSENTQISFCFINGSGVLTLTSLDPAVAVSVEFGMRVATRLRNRQAIQSSGDPTDRPQVAQSGSTSRNVRRHTVTADFAANEVITLSTGAGAGTGTSTVPGSGHGSDTISSLGASAAAFNTNDNIVVSVNGVQQVKGVDVNYGSSGSLSFAFAIFVNDVFMIDEIV